MRVISDKDQIIGNILIREGDQIEYKNNKILIMNESEAYNRDRINKVLDAKLKNLEPSSLEYELTKIQDGPIYTQIGENKIEIERPIKSNYKEGWSVFNWDRIKMKYTDLYSLSQHSDSKYLNSPLIDIRTHVKTLHGLDFNELIFFDTNFDRVHCLAVKKDMGEMFATSFSEQFRVPVLLVKFKMTFYKWFNTFPKEVETFDDSGLYQAFNKFVSTQLLKINRIF